MLITLSSTAVLDHSQTALRRVLSVFPEHTRRFLTSYPPVPSSGASKRRLCERMGVPWKPELLPC